MSPDQIRFLVDRAFRIAASERCVTCIIVPKDVQEMDAVETPAHKHGTVHSGAGYSPPRVIPTESDLKKAADVLNAGEKVAILVGAGAMGALDELLLVQDMLGAGIAKALLGRAVVPDDLPFVTGSIGLLGTKPSWDMMQECDTLLLVGTNFPYSEFLPKENAARGIQIDINPKLLGIRYPMELNLVGDSRLTLGALLPYLQRKEDRSWERKIASWVSEWWRLMDDRSRVPANPINPQRVFWELSPRIPEKAILASDSGSAANWFARDIKIRRGMLTSISGSLATMGCAVPYAIGAKFGHPDRPVIALVGDGAMQMNGMAELLTIKKYWKEWKNPQLVVLVLHNNDLNQVTWEMRAMEGDSRYAASQDLPEMDYAGFANLIGLAGVRVDKPENLGAAWDQAFASRMPFVLDAVVDPDVPPLPPHISLEEAKAFGMSILKGGASDVGVVRQALGNLFPSLAKKH
jgi:pyruvate dehydrogenase (quinone)